MLFFGIIIGIFLGIIFEIYKSNIDDKPKETVKYYFIPESEKYEFFVDADPEEVLKL